MLVVILLSFRYSSIVAYPQRIIINMTIIKNFTLHMINTRGSSLLKKKVYVFIGIFISLMIPILFIVMGYVATGIYLILEVLYVTVSSGIQNF